jgi:hypothetical protein
MGDFLDIVYAVCKLGAAPDAPENPYNENSRKMMW